MARCRGSSKALAAMAGSKNPASTIRRKALAWGFLPLLESRYGDRCSGAGIIPASIAHSPSVNRDGCFPKYRAEAPSIPYTPWPQ
ncbi:hypothetical protein Mapa_017649 [Marchantia paleacea]|nr:hypothetical protein Mapa_017649 [Marchantia paleacea]